MKEIQAISLLCLSMAAVLFDLKEERIPNSIIMTGVLCGGAYQLFQHGMMGITIYLGGVLLPILLFGWFFGKWTICPLTTLQHMSSVIGSI